MFEHSVRVPRSYKLAGTILQKVKENGENLKGLLYQAKNKHFRVQVIHALIFEALRHENQINDLIVKSKLLINENRLDPWLARILITELIWGKQKLPGQSKPEQAIKKYQTQFEQILESVGASKSIENDPVKEVVKPRYVRVNTLRTAAADAVRHFQDEGWHLVRCTSKSYDDYLKQVEKLAEDEFIPDFHVKVVFAFPPNTLFHNDLLYLNYDMFLQDKATCLAPFILSPTPGSIVLDMCAAPGMKTTHLAALMKNEGTIYAIEQNVERYKVLCEFIESSGATCVKAINGDAAEINKITCPNVDYVLLDPSCSGSGISRAEGNDSVFDLESGRVHKLAGFQAKLLRHALNEFRTAKRVVYSTCSLYCEENEAVIQDVVRNHKGCFRLVSAKEKLNGNWNNVGDPKFGDIGEKCLYARPSSDFTCGFFIAVFENMKEEIDKTAKEIKKLAKSINVDDDKITNGFHTNPIDPNNDVELGNDIEVTKSNKKKNNTEIKDGEKPTVEVQSESKILGFAEIICNDDTSEAKKHKKKRKTEIDDTKNIVDNNEDNLKKNGLSEKKKLKKNCADGVQNASEGLISGSEIEIQKKKSKKHHRGSTLLDNDISAIHLNASSIETEVNKSAGMVVTAEQNIVDNKSIVEPITTKKKRKSEFIDLCEDIADNVDKKKKDKKYFESEMDTNGENIKLINSAKKIKIGSESNCAVNQETITLSKDEHVLVTKDKKKASKSSSVADVTSASEEKEVMVKDKKKKKGDSILEAKVDLTLENSADEVKEKKSKKKKTEKSELDYTKHVENDSEKNKEKSNKEKKYDSSNVTRTDGIDESVKKRKKKGSESDNVLLTDGIDESVKERKKKKKEPESVNVSPTGGIDESVKERKKKGSDNVTQIDCLDETIRERKKKRKTCESDFVTQTGGIDESFNERKKKKKEPKSDIVSQTEDINESVKERKKKRKDCESVNATETGGIDESVKERKKKRKECESVNMTQTDDINESAKERKKKRIECESVNGGIDESVIERNKKNKACESDNISQTGGIDESVKERKKKIKESESVNVTQTSGIDEPVKERKKKMRESDNVTQTGDIDETIKEGKKRKKECDSTNVAQTD